MHSCARSGVAIFGELLSDDTPGGYGVLGLLGGVSKHGSNASALLTRTAPLDSHIGMQDGAV